MYRRNTFNGTEGAEKMLSDIVSGCEVYLVTEYTDMRKVVDGLAAIVQGKLLLDPFSKALFLFCGRNRSKMKGLL